MSADSGQRGAYSSGIPYEDARIHAAAVYCSDGRIGEQMDDFLHNGLALPRYDRLALPGGPAWLAEHGNVTQEYRGVIESLRFLAEVHRLARVVLIAHAGCAFYGQRLGLTEPWLELQQRNDLVRAAAVVRRIAGIKSINAFFARRDGALITFEPVMLPGTGAFGLLGGETGAT